MCVTCHLVGKKALLLLIRIIRKEDYYSPFTDRYNKRAVIISFDKSGVFTTQTAENMECPHIALTCIHGNIQVPITRC